MDNQQPHSFPQAPFHHLLQQQHQRLQMLWNYQCHEIEHTTNFKNHELPLARIKKITKADEDVRMISAEAPIVFAKACKLFILDHVAAGAGGGWVVWWRGAGFGWAGLYMLPILSRERNGYVSYYFQCFSLRF